MDTEKLERVLYLRWTDNRSVHGFGGCDERLRVVFKEAYGIISEDGIPATPESIYRIGSITKSYTAAMILQLVDRGELTLDTTLDTYFPDMQNAGQITIEQMLRHQSGLVNFSKSAGLYGVLYR